MSYLRTELICHRRKVQSLYKRALRTLEDWAGHDRHVFRFNAVVMRDRFDQNRKELDMRKSKELLALGEEELFLNQHWQPRKFANSPGGVAYGREPMSQDHLLDYWHPSEKAMYPDYFAKREQRKKEYVEMWEKQYGKPEADSSHH